MYVSENLLGLRGYFAICSVFIEYLNYVWDHLYDSIYPYEESSNIKREIEDTPIL